MKMFRSLCHSCGVMAYIFPDQIELIKKNPNVALHKFTKEKLSVGSKWFCIACDASNRNGRNCKIIAELTGEEAAKRIKVRKRNTNMESMGFKLPNIF